MQNGGSRLHKLNQLKAARFAQPAKRSTTILDLDEESTEQQFQQKLDESINKYFKKQEKTSAKHHQQQPQLE